MEAPATAQEARFADEAAKEERAELGRGRRRPSTGITSSARSGAAVRGVRRRNAYALQDDCVDLASSWSSDAATAPTHHHHGEATAAATMSSSPRMAFAASSPIGPSGGAQIGSSRARRRAAATRCARSANAWTTHTLQVSQNHSISLITRRCRSTTRKHYGSSAWRSSSRATRRSSCRRRSAL